jgi:ribonuclease PH
MAFHESLLHSSRIVVADGWTDMANITGAFLQLFDVNSQRISLREIPSAGIHWIEMNQYRVQ